MHRFILPFLFFAIFLFSPRPIFASENFDIDSTTYYKVEDKIATVTQDVTITNKKEFIYAPSFSITLTVKDIKNMQVTSNGGALPFSVDDIEGGGKKIEITFPDRRVGVGNAQSFTLSYTTESILTHLGSTWEINIPGLTSKDDFDEYNVEIEVPDTSDNIVIIKPHTSPDREGNKFVFNKDSIAENGVLIVFGDNEYYKADLTYSITNANLFPIKTEIALPPQTGYQEVILESINPQPERIYLDPDGNWLAEYILNPQENKKIIATSIIKVYSHPYKQGEASSTQLTAKDKYWDTTASGIRERSEKLSSPREIYDYVVDTLNYNNERVAGASIDRLGATGALANPSNSVCLEFTDTFIALTRAKGIPARSVEGYAFTVDENRPQSLVEDILHAWPEYYDKDKKTWVMVDPTWGNTTNLDYFNSLDFAHVAFVVKGEESTYPIPAGGYKDDQNEKSIHMSFVNKDEFQKTVSYDIQMEKNSFTLPGITRPSVTVKVKNTGNSLSESDKIMITSELSPHNQTYTLPPLPPHGEDSFTLHFDKTPLLTEGEYKITMQLNGQSVTKVLAVDIPTIPIAMGGGVLALGTVLLTFAAKARRVPLQRQK